MSKKSDSPKKQRIQVFARCRPMEEKLGSASMMEVLPELNKLVLKDRNSFREYMFDQVFSPDSEQITVYEAVVAPLIQEVIMGYSCTVFAYGQTGTGKTYTMEGQTKCSWKDDPNAGIIPRSLNQLYEELNQAENLEFSVKVSFLEIYNEDIYDLLSSSDFTKLRLYEDCNIKDSVKVRGLEEILVKTKDELYSIFEKGTSKRHTAETKLNLCSSRSHTVFSVMVNIIEKAADGGNIEKFGKLNLVDLAGSENVRRSGAVDKRAREAGSINQSLLTLGRVITALIDKQAHVPYRESKLTRILQYSLSGHAKTSFIATISPALCNLDETISTLEYASKAKSIDINPELNRRIQRRELVKELTSECDRLRMENEALTKDLAAARSNQGFFIDAENYESMKQNITVMDKDILSLKAENLKLHREVVLATNDIEELHAKIRRTQAVAYNNEDICDGLRMLSQKQCTDLYNKVEDHSEERIKFSKCFKEDLDRLTSELSEHRKNTDCIHEMLSNELQSFLDSALQHLNGQATSERQRANALSQDLKLVKDSLVSEFNGFLTERLPSLLDDLNAENASIKDRITNIHMTMKEKVNQHINVLNNQTTEEKKQLSILTGVLGSFFMNHDASIVKYNHRVNSFIRKLVEKMENVSNNFAMVKEEMNNIVQFENISRFEDDASQLRTAQVPLDALDRLIRTNEQEGVQFSDIFDNIKLKEFFLERKSNKSFCSKMTNALNGFNKSQIDNFEKASAKIESCNSEDLGNIKIKNCLVNDIASISNKIDDEHRQDKFDIQTYILAHLGEVFAESEKSRSNFSSQLQGSILEKDLDMGTFISEAFVKDISTGTTPQQRTIQFPRRSRATSPNHGFLLGFQNRMNAPLKENDESNCADVSSFLKSQDISSASDVYEYDGCESESAIELETRFADTEKGSDKENEEVSRLPKRKSVQLLVPPAMNSDQPLNTRPLSSLNTNSEGNSSTSQKDVIYM